MGKKNTGKKIFLVILFIYLFIPVLATILFSVAGKWDFTILPQSYTLKYYVKIFSDPVFVSAMLRSVEITIMASLLSVAVIVPCVYIGVTHYRKMITLFEILAMIPFILPGVVLAIGLIEMYSSLPFDITGTVWILLGAYFILCLPFTFQTVHNSFRSIDAKSLVDAALMLGCNESSAFAKVVMPNIINGIVIATLLDISILFGDFVLVNLLVGDNFSTIQIYLYQQIHKDGHIASAVVSTYLVVIVIISFVAIMLTDKNRGRMRAKQ